MRTFADYQLVEQLQKGNHGTFFIAKPPARLGYAEDLVALKILDRHATDNEFKRMAAELQLLLELEHPHIVGVLDAGHENGRLYYTTRYFRDGSLSPGPTNDLAGVATQIADVAEAAHALHEVGVAHRDIKPSNILLAGGRGHLSDLGVANYADANFTTTGSSPVGTLEYADPRLLHGDPPGRASDIWSLGASLHAAVTGNGVLGDIPNIHLAGAIEYIMTATASVHPSCPEPLASIVGKATKPVRAERYLTAADLATELRDASRQLSGPAAAPPPPPPPAPPPPPVAIAPPQAQATAGVANVEDTSPPLGVEGTDDLSGPDQPFRQPVLVIGQRSVAGHFNHPRATVCWQSGEVKGSRGPWQPARDLRPPLGVLLFEDGRSYVLRWNTILGRQPDTDERVAAGWVAPLSVEAELTMSRAHLYVELREWDVYATDISANGTTLVSAATGGRAKLPPQQPTRIDHGDTFVIENLTITFESHHKIG